MVVISAACGTDLNRLRIRRAFAHAGLERLTQWEIKSRIQTHMQYWWCSSSFSNRDMVKVCLRACMTVIGLHYRCYIAGAA